MAHKPDTDKHQKNSKQKNQKQQIIVLQLHGKKLR